MATDGITPGKHYHLVNVHQDRGLTVRVHTSWDWVITRAGEGDHGASVVFEANDGGGYVIRSSWSNYGEHVYWTWAENGIYLDKYEPASLWHTIPTANGFGLFKHQSDQFLYSPGGDQYVKTADWKQARTAEILEVDVEEMVSEDPEARKRFEFKVIPA
ncbi:hypothetical protein [Nocardiopsis sp. CNS-639]|uniref:hypothetical protein n=1 Tax=Nocardiopsis sp. CNS-639 TaxID=1169153 RepID=UPI0012DCB98C|nr:hypothetical protein [Nocardiopsis sp. CNS-639]